MTPRPPSRQAPRVAGALALALAATLAACGPNGCEALPWGPPQATAPPGALPDTPPVQPAPIPVDPDAPALVDLMDVDSSIRVDLRYATPNNFLHHAVYPTNRCLLRPTTAERLKRAQARLTPVGLGLLVWDCYRPLHIQQEMWQLMPDPRYVADPKEGSKHNRGAAVDVTLVKLAGDPLDLGTDHDDFTEKAARGYKEFPYEVLRNRKVLENAMALEGFLPFESEWWHFDDPDWQRFPILDEKLYVPPEERGVPSAAAPAAPAPTP